MISWTDRCHSLPAAGYWTDPSPLIWSEDGRVSMTKLTTRYDPASAAAVSEHSQTELREEPRSGYLKHQHIRTGRGPKFPRVSFGSN